MALTQCSWPSSSIQHALLDWWWRAVIDLIFLVSKKSLPFQDTSCCIYHAKSIEDALSLHLSMHHWGHIISKENLQTIKKYNSVKVSLSKENCSSVPTQPLLNGPFHKDNYLESHLPHCNCDWTWHQMPRSNIESKMARNHVGTFDTFIQRFFE